MSTQEFAPSDLRRFEQRGAEAIALAMALGWGIRWSNKRRTAASLRSPSGDKVILVPTTSINANRSKAIINQVITHSPPERLEVILRGTLDMRADNNVARFIAVTGTAIFETVKEVIEAKRGAAAEADHLTQKIADALPEPVAQEPEEPAAEVPFTTLDDAVAEAKANLFPRPTVVSRTPYLVRRNGPTSNKGEETYESKAVDVITYSDGSVAYGCQHCDRVADKPMRISTHAGQAHRGLTTPDYRIEQQSRGIAVPSPRFTPRPPTEREATVPEATTHQPALRGLPLLTHHLRSAMIRSDQARDVAVAICDLDFETRARLANVILMGRESETMRAAAEERIAEVEAERDAARAEAERLQAWKTSFQDLLTAP